jgi:2-(1,2-epoxy-1,2-dihydrophenyl)acetyl-CoA isomerase
MTMSTMNTDEQTAMTAFETIRFDVDGPVARITLNRPEDLNPLSLRMAGELLEALGQVESDVELRAVLLTGAGRGFSSGADLKGDRPLTADGKPDVLTGLREVYNPLMVKLRRLEKPVVAAVNGPAVGIGASLAAACDLVIAAQSAYFLLAFVNIGLTLDGGASVSFAARIGHGRAAELALLGERLPAATAVEWGLANRVVPDAELQAEAGELAAKLAAGPPGSYASTKQLLNAVSYPSYEQQLEREAVLQQQRAESADFVEGVLARFQKRAPRFTGS